MVGGHEPSRNPRRPSRESAGSRVPVKEEIRAQRRRAGRGRRAARRRRARLRGHRAAAARERAARRPRRDLPRRARPGEDPHDPLAHRACSTSGCRSSPGSEINDDPYHPVSQHARDLVAEQGDDTPIEWVHRDRRFGEKLATPDTSIADLIGEVDPIKVAEGRYLSDELTIHYGLVPRTNRGIFAINELPDLAERIQVGLLNVLEERDVQIRGYKIRLPLDVMLFASANPEDYTNRGRIITPLKDRFGSQIRTHYPLEVEHRDGDHRPGGARRSTAEGLQVTVPDFMTEIVAELSQLARQSPHVNQRSGVSVRLTDRRTTRRSSPTRPGARCATARREVVPAGQRPRRAGVVDDRQDRDRDARRGPRGADVERIAEGARCSRCSGARSARTLGARGRHVVRRRPVVHTGDDVPSARHRDAARPSIPALRQPCSPTSTVGESPAGGRERHRVRARGPAPLQAPQQGRGRHPRHLPRPAANRRRHRRSLAALGARSRGVAVAVEAAELHVEAVEPLVVVDAGPVEEAADVDAVGDRPRSTSPSDSRSTSQRHSSSSVPTPCSQIEQRPARQLVVQSVQHDRRALRSTARTPSARPRASAGTARSSRRRRRRSRRSTRSRRGRTPPQVGDLALGRPGSSSTPSRSARIHTSHDSSSVRASTAVGRAMTPARGCGSSRPARRRRAARATRRAARADVRARRRKSSTSRRRRELPAR